MDEEAGVQVVQRDRRDVVAQPRRRFQAPEHVASELRAGRVVAHERHASAVEPARRGLGGIVQERGPAQRVAAGELVRERLVQQRADLVVEPRGDGIALQQRDAVEHLERVVVDVRVVEAALLDPAQRDELGQHDLGEPVRLHDREPAPHVGGADHALELREHPLVRHLRDPGRVPGGGFAGRRVDLQPDFGRDPHRPQAAQRVVLQRALAHHPHEPQRQIALPAVRVDQLAAAERLGHRVDGEVARGEVGEDVVVAQRHEVDVPRVARARPPATRRTRRESWNAGRARRAREPPSRTRFGSPGTARSTSSTSRPSSLSRTAPPTSHAVSPASAARAMSSASLMARTRGTRAVSPQVIS